MRNPVPRSIGRKCNGTPASLALLFVLALSGCTTFKPPQISYDDDVPPSPDLPMPADDHARPLHVPPSWTATRGGKKGDQEAKEPTDRIGTANDAARVEPRRAGYFNAVQVFPYSPGALYQIYASPGRITDIALEPGEQLTGSGPLAAGDTVRWIVGDTESGNGNTRRVHIMVKPTRPAIETNLVVNTDRRTYLIELRSREKPYAFGRMVLPGRPIQPLQGFATNAGHSGGGPAPLPLRHRRGQPTMAAGQCLR